MKTVIPDVELCVPKCFILATSIFDDFMEQNSLVAPALNATSDDEIHDLFSKATLPPEVTDSLRVYLDRMSGPLAVRSSSLFEDAFMQPFAGICAPSLAACAKCHAPRATRRTPRAAR